MRKFERYALGALEIESLKVEANWIPKEVELCRAATGMKLLDTFYRLPGRPRAEQSFLATVWQKA